MLGWNHSLASTLTHQAFLVRVTLFLIWKITTTNDYPEHFHTIISFTRYMAYMFTTCMYYHHQHFHIEFFLQQNRAPRIINNVSHIPYHLIRTNNLCSQLKILSLLLLLGIYFTYPMETRC